MAIFWADAICKRHCTSKCYKWKSTYFMTSETHPEINDSEDDFIEVGNDDENSIDTLFQETPGSVS